MFLQTLFALSALVPAITAFVPSSIGPSGPDGPGLYRSNRSHITIMGGRRFTAEVFPAKSASFESRYPGAIVIATEETRDRAFLVAGRLSEIGVTVIMYTQAENVTHRFLVFDAMGAIDSMRRRGDVRTEEIGVIAFEEATTVVPDLVRDTTISFAIAASVTGNHDVGRRYAEAHAATLVVQGIDSVGATAAKMLGDTPPPITTTTIDPTPAASTSAPSAAINVGDTGVPQAPVNMAPNVTVWPVPKSQLAGIGEAHSPLGLRVVSWIREQVHAAPTAQQQKSVIIH